MKSKQCNTCKEVKPADLFYRNRRNKDGRGAKCKACDAIVHRRYWKKVRSKKKQAVSKKDMEIIRELKYSTNDDQFLKEDLTYLYGAKKILDEWKSIRCKSNNAQRMALLKHGEALCTKCGYVKSVEEFKKRILKCSIMCKRCEKVQLQINREMLSNSYIIKLLVGQSGLSRSDIPEALVRVKRQQQQIKRITRRWNEKNKNNEKNNRTPSH